MRLALLLGTAIALHPQMAAARDKPAKVVPIAPDAFKAIAAQEEAVLLSTYPPNAVEFGTYKVRPNESKIFIQRLYLPKAFTLTVDPSITEIEWVVNSIEFGNRAVINLNTGRGAPPTPDAIPALPQAALCRRGEDGRQGRSGEPGVAGVSFKLTVLGGSGASGTLWIHSDGNLGGDGGVGQNGQKGSRGIGNIGPVRIRCPAAPGGRPGRGGGPGAGGQPGKVTVAIGSQGTILPESVEPGCGPITQDPGDMQPNLDIGSILIRSRPGCPGREGPPGQPGAHG